MDDHSCARRFLLARGPEMKVTIAQGVGRPAKRA